MPDPYSEFPPVADVVTWAQILGCHPQSLRRAIAAGHIQSVRLGRLVKIPRHSVVAFLTQNDDPDATNVGAVQKRNAPAHVSG